MLGSIQMVYFNGHSGECFQKRNTLNQSDICSFSNKLFVFLDLDSDVNVSGDDAGLRLSNFVRIRHSLL